MSSPVHVQGVCCDQVEPFLRKHDRWWTLTHEHAALVWADDKVAAIFKAHCGLEPWVNVIERYVSRTCLQVPDGCGAACS